MITFSRQLSTCLSEMHSLQARLELSKSYISRNYKTYTCSKNDMFSLLDRTTSVSLFLVNDFFIKAMKFKQRTTILIEVTEKLTHRRIIIGNITRKRKEIEIKDREKKCIENRKRE